jgi:hypothetical protein
METERFEMPPEITDKMRTAAYQEYCRRVDSQGYFAFEDVCACFRAAFAARSLGGRDD